MIDEGKEGHNPLEDTAQHPPVEISPDEKLAGTNTIASPVPGAQTIEGDSVKQEFNPNTE